MINNTTFSCSKYSNLNLQETEFPVFQCKPLALLQSSRGNPSFLLTSHRAFVSTDYKLETKETVVFDLTTLHICIA